MFNYREQFALDLERHLYLRPIDYLMSFTQKFLAIQFPIILYSFSHFCAISSDIFQIIYQIC